MVDNGKVSGWVSGRDSKRYKEHFTCDFWYLYMHACCLSYNKLHETHNIPPSQAETHQMVHVRERLKFNTHKIYIRSVERIVSG